ncbi:MAG: PEP-CTERM sorting domain-containing protein [Bryobacteraceae bacterium]
MRSSGRLFVVGLLVLGSSFQAPALELLVNPGFEDPTPLLGWTVSNLTIPPSPSLGTFQLGTGVVSPLSGHPTAGPHGGTQYAISDQNNSGAAGAHALSQLFTIPGPSQLITLSFWIFVNDQRNALPEAESKGFDYTGASSPNARTRVDLLLGSATIFSLNPADIVSNRYSGNGLLNNQAPSMGGCNIAAPPFYCPWQFVTLDITNLVTPGQQYLLRFADVISENFYQTGVDDVSVNFLVPEPGTLMLCGLGLLGAGVWRRRKRAE